MKTLLGALLFALATQVYAQALEADLDGNASALQASEMRPAPQAKKGVRTLFLGTARSSPEKGS
ncbi:MAG TPA: hypothetical protein VNP36_21840 [Burkholderiales bacterium]|nr:hypothetical protein [Burkholderiales bacterium]